MTTPPEERTATLSELVAQEIDSVRGRKRWSQAQLARAIGKTEMWVSLRLRGKQEIGTNDLALIAKALDVDVHDLLPSPDAVRRAVDASNGAKEHLPEVNRSADPGRVSAPYPRHTAGAPGPMSPQRRDPTRPQSAVPATKRRPTTVRSPSRPMAA